MLGAVERNATKHSKSSRATRRTSGRASGVDSRHWGLSRPDYIGRCRRSFRFDQHQRQSEPTAGNFGKGETRNTRLYWESRRLILQVLLSGLQSRQKHNKCIVTRSDDRGGMRDAYSCQFLYPWWSGSDFLGTPYPRIFLLAEGFNTAPATSIG